MNPHAPSDRNTSNRIAAAAAARPTTTSLPILCLQEAKDFKVNVEVLSGERYFGRLVKLDGAGDMHLEEVLHRAVDGAATVMQRITIRGHQIRLVMLPKNIKHAPFLQSNVMARNATIGNPREKELVGTGTQLPSSGAHGSGRPRRKLSGATYSKKGGVGVAGKQTVTQKQKMSKKERRTANVVRKLISGTGVTK